MKRDMEMAAAEYTLAFGPASTELAKNLSVLQCPTCCALVVEDFLSEHMAWHAVEDKRA